MFRYAKRAALVSVVLLAACSSDPQTQRAGTGALIGAGAGALIGQAAGRNTASTLIGAATGAVVGGAVGAATTPKQQMCRYRGADGRIFEAPCDQRYYNGNY
jgi:outer membrane lipoprotein SlyB